MTRAPADRPPASGALPPQVDSSLDESTVVHAGDMGLDADNGENGETENEPIQVEIADPVELLAPKTPWSNGGG